MDKMTLEEGLGTVIKYLTESSIELEQALVKACRNVNEQEAKSIMPRLVKVHSVKRISEDAMAAATVQADKPTYRISSLFLKDAFNALSGAPEEDMRFATGIVLGPNMYAVTRLMKFKLSIKSAVYAKGDQVSVNKVLIYLYHNGHLLLVTLHIHPGGGPEANYPSGIDMDLHKRLESGKYPVIGAIFCREGYVRFFSYEREFKVSIYGNGVEVIDANESLFKLTDIGPVQG